MTAPAPHPTPRPRPAIRLTVGIALVLLWAAALVLPWVQGFRVVTAEQLREDVAAERVVDQARVEVSGQFGRWWQRTVLDASTEPEALLAYRTDGGGVRLVAGAERSPERVVLGERPTAEETRGLAEVLEADGIPTANPWAWQSAWTAGPLLGWALPLIGLGLVVLGPRPTRGNRWGWFWLLGLPAGLGVALYAWSEWLRPARTPPLRRWGGGLGVMGLVAGTVVGAAFTVLLVQYGGIPIIPR